MVKNSETDISRCRAPISTADTVTAGRAGFAAASLASVAFGSGPLAPAALGDVAGRPAAGTLDRTRVFGLASGIAVISRPTMQAEYRNHPARSSLVFAAQPVDDVQPLDPGKLSGVVGGERYAQRQSVCPDHHIQ